MYKVDAIIRHDRLDEVKNSLVAQGFEEFSVTELRGYVAHHAVTACYRGITYEIPFTPQVRLELNVPDESLDIVVESIIGAARTGKPGDGKIFVTQLAEVVEINLNLPVPPLHAPTAPRPRLASV